MVGDACPHTLTTFSSQETCPQSHKLGRAILVPHQLQYSGEQALHFELGSTEVLVLVEGRGKG